MALEALSEVTNLDHPVLRTAQCLRRIWADHRPHLEGKIMADAQMGPVNENFVDKRRGRTQDGVVIAEQANMQTVAGLKARLTTLAAAKYPAANLAKMTVNDLVYALRLESSD